MDVVEGDDVQDFRGTDARRFQHLAEKAAKGELRVINVGSGNRDRLGLNSKTSSGGQASKLTALRKEGALITKFSADEIALGAISPMIHATNLGMLMMEFT